MTDFNANTDIPIEHFSSVDSTNALLKRRISEGKINTITAVTADEQTAGRGRRGRTWLNTEGSLMMSAAFPLTGIDPDNIPLVSIAAALAARSAVCFSGVDAVIKWPNDVIVLHEDGYRKLAGILSELASSPGGELFAVIGIGINANCSSMPENLMQPASSLLIEKGTETALEPLANKLLAQLVSEMEALKQDGGAVLARFAENCVTLGKSVEAQSMDGTIVAGEAIGLDPRGRLLIKTGERTVAVGAADVSVHLANKNTDEEQ